MRIDITAIDKTRINKNKQSHPFDETVYTISQRNKKRRAALSKATLLRGRKSVLQFTAVSCINGLIAMDEDNCMVYV